MGFPVNPFHTLKRWMEDNAARGEAARRVEAAKQSANDLLWRQETVLDNTLPMEGVACPSCGWVPPRGATWLCDCGHQWNTFETGGQCPRCRKIWHATLCLSCNQLLAHREWYVDR